MSQLRARKPIGLFALAFLLSGFAPPAPTSARRARAGVEDDAPHAKKGKKAAAKKGKKPKTVDGVEVMDDEPEAELGGDAAAAEAKALFEEGNRWFSGGNFEKALETFKRAYDKKPVPVILMNIGQCLRNLGRYEESIFYYKKYLAEVPSSPHAPALAEVIREMEIKDAERKVAEAEKVAAEKAASIARAEAERKSRAEKEALTAMEASRAARASAEAAAARRETVKRKFYNRWWFWTAVGGAVVLAGAGTTLGLLAVKPPDEGSLGLLDLRREEIGTTTSLTGR